MPDSQGNEHRIPPSVPNPLNPETPRIQVNHCRMPTCENFGVPAREQFGSSGPSQDRDQHYTVVSTAKGRVPAIKCKSCGEKPPIKSNQGIAEEIERISEPLRTPEELASCQQSGCENHGKTVATYPECYRKCGYDKETGNPKRKCCSCGHICTIKHKDAVQLHKKHRHLAKEIFERTVNKSPIRRILAGVGQRKNQKIYYTIARFARKRCNRLSGAIDNGMVRGEVPLPRTMNLQVDVQEYILNWTNRLDRRNPKFSAICTVDKDSRYVLGIHANYDPDADAFGITHESASRGDIGRQEAFRRHARYWLPGDEFRGGRSAGQKTDMQTIRELDNQIATVYRAAQGRDDIEDFELHQMTPEIYNPNAGAGMQVHIPYTAYAHFFLMREMLVGAGVRSINYSMDCEAMLRAGFLSAFQKEIQNGSAHGFYVRGLKYLTVMEKNRATANARSVLRSFAKMLPPEERHEAARLLMEQRIHEAEEHGRWHDRWITHPRPTMNEPEKSVCHLTPHPSVGIPQLAGMALDAGLGAVDNVFQGTRRFSSSLERPVGTSSGYNTVWHGYAPYNPAMLQLHLDLLRCAWNYCRQSENDDLTPAMRLGIADRPLTFDNVLWAGQQIPEPPPPSQEIQHDLPSRWKRQVEREHDTVEHER